MGSQSVLEGFPGASCAGRGQLSLCGLVFALGVSGGTESVTLGSDIEEASGFVAKPRDEAAALAPDGSGEEGGVTPPAEFGAVGMAVGWRSTTRP